MAEQYRKEIAPNPNLELIHISFDQTSDKALTWAKSLEQPWPVLLNQDAKDEQLTNNVVSIPSYVLVDRNGKEVARGKNACLAAVSKDKA